jgi:hypothetical protein
LFAEPVLGADLLAQLLLLYLQLLLQFNGVNGPADPISDFLFTLGIR